MGFIKRNIGRRQFISLGSMVIGAGMLTKPSSLLFAAEGAPQEGAPWGARRSTKDDGTKYGKYILLAPELEQLRTDKRGMPVQGLSSMDVPEATMSINAGRMPPPGPMPARDWTEKHEFPEILCHIGNHPDDPLDLGAEAELYLGKGSWYEKYLINKSTMVYLPTGFWHCPWQIKKIHRSMTWLGVKIGLPPGSSTTPSEDPPSLTEEEWPKRPKTSGYLFDKYVVSGVGKNILGKKIKDPEGGKWIAYMDCLTITEAPLMRIIRYNPEEAPYSILDKQQIHEYESVFMFLSTDLDDPTDLAAEIEFSIGPEKEKHTFNKWGLVYIPAHTVHGPLRVTKAKKPFNFVELVAGPELPGAVYEVPSVY